MGSYEPEKEIENMILSELFAKFVEGYKGLRFMDLCLYIDNYSKRMERKGKILKAGDMDALNSLYQKLC